MRCNKCRKQVAIIKRVSVTWVDDLLWLTSTEEKPDHFNISPLNFCWYLENTKKEVIDGLDLKLISNEPKAVLD